MKLHFSLPYRTGKNEQIKAVMRLSGLGRPGRECILPLNSTDGENWRAELELALPPGAELIYHYAVYENGAAVRREWRAVPRKLVIGPSPARRCELRDFWRDAPALAPLYSTAYTRSTPEHAYRLGPDKLFDRTLILRASAPQLKEDETLCVCGEETILGVWNPSFAAKMEKTSLHEWSVSLDARYLHEGAPYKFIVCGADGTVRWEEGENRALPALPGANGETFICGDYRPAFAYAPWRIAGTVLPVFSIRTERSWGVGDFGDLKLLADWAALTGQKVIQLLPVNDTTQTGTWSDSYPYNAVSVYALHPMYADLGQLPPLKDTQKAAEFEAERKRLNSLAQVDYEGVNKLKREYLRLSFLQDGAQVLAKADFKRFFERGKSWLVPYAAFSYLRGRFGTADFAKWPRYAAYDRAEIEKLCAPSGAAYGQISFYYYVQYVLHEQLLGAAKHARAKGVLLKGDIAIGVSRNSADVWARRELFNLNAQAGAPADPFSATGQNWGFPTYNWEEMAKDGYAWWKGRIEKMAEYFDAYRIDHVLGFFRIWEIPLHSVQGLLGQFSPALGMSREEIESFGLTWKDAFLRPFVSGEMLETLFGPYAAEVKAEYLTPDGAAPLGAYDTQRKVQAALADGDDAKTQKIRDGLYALLSQVLFVPDRAKPDLYHPRIAAPGDWAFNALGEAERAAFLRLYNHYFYERNNEFWTAQALKKLPVLTQSARMLPCAEDLGMIPSGVPGVLDKLKILSLEIQRMPKSPGLYFADTAQYPWLSVCSVSTHDMSTLRGWWKEDRALTQKFYNEVLGLVGQAPPDAPADACERVVRMHAASPSLLCALSFADWTSMDEKLRSPDVKMERVNVPSNPRQHWSYRMHVSVETLMKNDAFNARLRRIIQESGR